MLYGFGFILFLLSTLEIKFTKLKMHDLFDRNMTNCK